MFIARFFESGNTRTHETISEIDKQNPLCYEKHQTKDVKVTDITATQPRSVLKEEEDKQQSVKSTLLHPFKNLAAGFVSFVTEKGQNKPLPKEAQTILQDEINLLWDEFEQLQSNENVNNPLSNPEGSKELLSEKKDDSKMRGIQIPELNNEFVIDTVLQYMSIILPKDHHETQTLVSSIDRSEDTESTLYKFIEGLKNVTEKEISKVEFKLIELKTNELPSLIQMVEDEAFSQINEWNKLSTDLEDIVNDIGTTSLSLQFKEKWYKSIAYPIQKLQVLMMSKYYITVLIECIDVLNKAQHELSRQHDLECLKVLSPLPFLVKQKGQHNGKWILHKSIRQYLSNRLQFILGILIANFTRSLQQSLENVAWGTQKFESFMQDAHQLEPVKTNIASLVACQRYHRLIELFENECPTSVDNFNTEHFSLYSAPPQVIWASACLASLLLVRFSSPLCRLNQYRQPVNHIISLTKSHCAFLLSCIPPSPSPFQTRLVTNTSPSTTSIKLSFDAQDGFEHCEEFLINEAVVESFVDLIAADLGYFTVQRFNYLKSGNYQIEPSDTPISAFQDDILTLDNKSSHSAFPAKAPLYNVITPSMLSNLMHEMIDDLVKSAEELAVLSPRSAKYIFVTPDIVKSDITVSKDMPPYSSTIARQKDNGRKDNTKLFKELFDTVTCEKEKVQDEASDTLINNCIDVLSLFDSQRLLQSLSPQFKLSSVLTPSVLTQPNQNDSMLYPNTPMSLTDIRHIGRTYKVSQSLRFVIEALQVCESRIAALTLNHPLELRSSYPNSLQIYSEVVYRPIWERMRIALRDAWNSLESPDTQITPCCLILDSFQLGVDFLKSEVFSSAKFLRNELTEWNRLREATFESLLSILNEAFKREMRRCMLSSSHSDFHENALKRFSVTSHAITMDVSRGQLLNSAAEFVVQEVFRYLDIRVNVLSPEQREIFVNNCCHIRDFIESLEFFIPSPELVSQLIKLRELTHLLTLESSLVKPLLQRLDILLSQKKASNLMLLETSHDDHQHAMPINNESNTRANTFIGVQLVVEAENFIRSTQQLLLPSSENIPTNLLITSTDDKISEEIQQLLRHDLQVSELNSRECFEILRKRREFCFTSSYK